jgi:nucleolar protein 58
MGLFVLTETSAGFALFKAKDKKILKKDDFSAEVQTAEGINDLYVQLTWWLLCDNAFQFANCHLRHSLKLKQFEKFDSAATALEEVAALVEGKVSPMLSKLLDSLKDEKKASLAVADPKLGQAINKLPGLTLTPISDSSVNDIYRAIRDHLPSLIPGLAQESISTMALGLSHSLSRHKLKFSPDKVDTMIVQAIALLDDLDKELNTYAMRVKEWYGWHFPEMGRIVNDNLAYARIILKVGMRTSCSTTDLTDILPEEIETAVKAAAEVSMGTEITDEDLENIKLLAEQVVGFTEYRQQLSSYLTARMQAIAPNLTELVGELVGARLIAHSGSLMNLAKSPASTIQILGAEKALFRALKTKHDTPKYGLIYHASLVGQATGKNKGKIARMLAAKATIGLRVDALSDWSAQGEGKGDDVDDEERSALGVLSRAKIERHLRGLEGKPLLPRGVAIGPNGKAAGTPGKWEVKEARKYNPDADGLSGDEPAAISPITPVPEKKTKKEKKEKKPEIKKPLIEEVPDHSASDGEEEEEEEAYSENEDEDVDVEMADVDAGVGLSNPKLNGTKAKPLANTLSNGNESDTISTVSEDTSEPPASPPVQWQSSILGNTREAKIARKKERHERKLAMSEVKSKKKVEKMEKEARRAEREERRQQKAAQDTRRAAGTEAVPTEDPDAKHAKVLDISLDKYKRKFADGQIKFTDGNPVYISKKELKKLKKAGKEPELGKKRKAEDEGEKSEKKKKKKDKSKN